MTLNILNDFDFKEQERKEGEAERTQSPQYVCDVCGKMFKLRSNLEVHIRIHNGTSLFNCEFCGKLFTQKISLKRHLPIHTKVPQYTCNICDKEFIHEKTYKRHMSNHTGLNSLHCPVCNLGIDSSTQLKRHMRSHTKEKPFSCDICGKHFSQKFNMYVHKRRIHENIDGPTSSSSQRRCPLCSMTYVKTRLAEHLSEYHNLIQPSIVS